MKWFVRPNGSFTLTPRLRFQLLECFCVEVFTLTYFALVMEMHWIGVGLCVSVIEDTIYILSYCHFRSSGPHTCPMSPRSCTEKAFIGKCWLFAIQIQKMYYLITARCSLFFVMFVIYVLVCVNDVDVFKRWCSSSICK